MPKEGKEKKERKDKREKKKREAGEDGGSPKAGKKTRELNVKPPAGSAAKDDGFSLTGPPGEQTITVKENRQVDVGGKMMSLKAGDKVTIMRDAGGNPIDVTIESGPQGEPQPQYPKGGRKAPTCPIHRGSECVCLCPLCWIKLGRQMVHMKQHGASANKNQF